MPHTQPCLNVHVLRYACSDVWPIGYLIRYAVLSVTSFWRPRRLTTPHPAPPPADVSTLLNSYLGSANHLARVPMEQADMPERFCRVSVLYNFTRDRMQRDTILPRYGGR